jgi:hypothetical protein
MPGGSTPRRLFGSNPLDASGKDVRDSSARDRNSCASSLLRRAVGFAQGREELYQAGSAGYTSDHPTDLEKHLVFLNLAA